MKRMKNGKNSMMKNSFPRLEERDGVIQLLNAEGEPMVLLCGELHNSSSSDPEYMKRVWPKLRDLGLNCVIATVSWELVEPEEGRFDFSMVDDLIRSAEAHGLKLILIWFATWKNALSTYPPEWVRTDGVRFPRALRRDGTKNRAISCFSSECRKLDARAFAALMKHLRKTDSSRTVLMMQVENEAGLLGTSRDFSPAANEIFARSIPEELSRYLCTHRAELSPWLSEYTDFSALEKSGNWQTVFGDAADEVFTAYYTAKYINAVAAAGKEEYPIPMFVNAWTVQAPGEPGGVHPSGGPVAELHDVWRCAAPDIDVFAPDLYQENFKEECARYTRLKGNPLLIPEMRRDRWMTGTILYAVGQGALCVSPFGIDRLGGVKSSSAAPVPEDAVLQDAVKSMGSRDQSPQLGKTYSLLRNLMPSILRYRGTNHMKGILQDSFRAHYLSFEKYDFRIVWLLPGAEMDIPGGGFIIETGPDDFLIAGIGFRAEVLPKKHAYAELLTVEEGRFEGETWKRSRRRNGDDLYLGMEVFEPSLLKTRIYSFD